MLFRVPAPVAVSMAIGTPRASAGAVGTTRSVSEGRRRRCFLSSREEWRPDFPIGPPGEKTAPPPLRLRRSRRSRSAARSRPFGAARGERTGRGGVRTRTTGPSQGQEERQEAALARRRRVGRLSIGGGHEQTPGDQQRGTRALRAEENNRHEPERCSPSRSSGPAPSLSATRSAGNRALAPSACGRRPCRRRRRSRRRGARPRRR